MTPDEHTIQETFVTVGNGQELYVHDWGNKQAKTPIVYLHGGPGGSCKDRNKLQFDPAVQRVIFFDQRGCGKSLPYGTLDQTTDDLVHDISTIADELSIKKFVLTGSSWGSCLALAYGIAHPERVVAMVLGGIFTGSQAEIDWLDTGMFRTFFPEAWERYLQTVSSSHRHNPGAYHYNRVMSDDEAAARSSGHAYASLEGSVMSLDDRFSPDDPADFDPSGMRVEMYYMHERCFMPDRHILEQASILTMPVWLVQGRYDMVCPPATAYELKANLPNGHLIWAISGHRAEHENWNVMRTILLQLGGIA